LKEPVKSSIAKIEDIILKNKKHQSIYQKENDDGDITGKTAEKLAEFFFTNGPHRLG
jgi:hypothetical protein